MENTWYRRCVYVTAEWYTPHVFVILYRQIGPDAFEKLQDPLIVCIPGRDSPAPEDEDYEKRKGRYGYIGECRAPDESPGFDSERVALIGQSSRPVSSGPHQKQAHQQEGAPSLGPGSAHSK